MRSVIVMNLFAYVNHAQKISHPAVLTHQIKKVNTIQALLCAYHEHASDLNSVHLSAC